jgi:hypothetical protein
MSVKLRYVWPLGALLAAALAALAIACSGGGDAERTIVIRRPSPTADAGVTATPTPARSPTPTRTPTPSPNVCGFNPDAAPPSLLQVQEPAPEAKVDNPFHLRGWGSEIGFENRGVVVAIINKDGDPVLSKDVKPESKASRIAPPGLDTSGHPAPFATDILLTDLREQTPFCIWVFTETTEDGQPKHVVQVPIIVLP